ncbi:MAG: phosphatidylglycerophosphatase A [Moorella humiferrea]|uniref:Phosphatidylglycerophosphatase A n=1 Tax=Neomoorella humiferrea TaxID=676965 RepID=A0A2T0ALK0_9FIRM|nr:phosphatidylglycerophosphatase A [Moorella humiferrea]MBE3573513.1 phosphatidylglycerophosphatase A [Moorella humiferrea]PRR69503.1 Phosphatidylglycerophosphatase A [Moorella humiferrea]
MSVAQPKENQYTGSPLLKRLAITWLERRGVTLDDIASLVYEVQRKYIPHLTMAACRESVERVLEKREVQNAIFTGIAIDELAEKGLLDEPLYTMLKNDDGLYGIDEILALSIVNIYGSIGFTNFGYLDKVKPGIIGVVNGQKNEKVNTFLDDLVAAVAAAASSRLAHRDRDGLL